MSPTSIAETKSLARAQVPVRDATETRERGDAIGDETKTARDEYEMKYTSRATSRATRRDVLGSTRL